MLLFVQSFHVTYRLAEVVIDTTTRLRTRSMPVKLESILCRLAEGAFERKRTFAMTIVVNKVSKRR